MDKLILLPLIISAIMLLDREPKEVFILVFLPFLTLLPVYFDTKLVSGIPELTFWSAALIPVLAAWTYRNFEGYSFHWMDLVVLSYIGVIFLGQWSNSTYKEAQKILFNNMMAIYFPYIMVRAFCENRDTLVRIIHIMTLLGAFIAFFNMLEFRLFTNYFDEILRRLWPRYVMWDTGMVMIRWGFKRALGPFSHPIVAGYFFALMAPLAVWCYNQNHYRNKNFGRLVVMLNIIGLFVSLSRAPMIGFILGLGIIYYGWSDKKAAIGTFLTVLLSCSLIVIIPKFIKYASVTRATAKTVDQRNVAYRKEMWEAYFEVVLERPYLGWGRFTVPVLKGMDSIDSEYLGVALASGIIVVFFYLVFLLFMLSRLLKFAFSMPHDDPWGRLAWCLIAGWCTAIFTQATVYSGAQTVQYLFMLGGVGQVLILTTPAQKLFSQKHDRPVQPAYIGYGFGFTRVV